MFSVEMNIYVYSFIVQYIVFSSEQYSGLSFENKFIKRDVHLWDLKLNMTMILLPHIIFKITNWDTFYSVKYNSVRINKTYFIHTAIFFCFAFKFTLYPLPFCQNASFYRKKKKRENSHELLSKILSS